MKSKMRNPFEFPCIPVPDPSHPAITVTLLIYSETSLFFNPFTTFSRWNQSPLSTDVVQVGSKGAIDAAMR